MVEDFGLGLECRGLQPLLSEPQQLLVTPVFSRAIFHLCIVLPSAALQTAPNFVGHNNGNSISNSNSNSNNNSNSSTLGC